MIKKMTPALTLMGMLVALLMAVLLTGCSTESAEKETTPAKQKEVTKTEEKAEEPAKKEETKKDDDGYEHGDKTQHVTKEFNKAIKIGDIQLDIRSAEIVTLENLTEEASAMFEMYGYEEGKPYNMMQIKYDVTNNSDKNVNFTVPVYTLVLSNGEQIDVSMDGITFDGGGGEFYANSNKKDLNVVIPFKSNPKEVTGFRIITDNVTDLDYNSLAEPVEAEFQF